MLDLVWTSVWLPCSCGHNISQHYSTAVFQTLYWKQIRKRSFHVLFWLLVWISNQRRSAGIEVSPCTMQPPQLRHPGPKSEEMTPLPISLAMCSRSASPGLGCGEILARRKWGKGKFPTRFHYFGNYDMGQWWSWAWEAKSCHPRFSDLQRYPKCSFHVRFVSHVPSWLSQQKFGLGLLPFPSLKTHSGARLVKTLASFQHATSVMLWPQKHLSFQPPKFIANHSSTCFLRERSNVLKGLDWLEKNILTYRCVNALGLSMAHRPIVHASVLAACSLVVILLHLNKSWYHRCCTWGDNPQACPRRLDQGTPWCSSWSARQSLAST